MFSRRNNWRRDRWFRRTPTEWNEAEFVFLDRTIAEAARHGLKVQICLANWWRDTGGVTQYLRWAGIHGADDDNYPYGINDEKAMAFYTNKTTTPYQSTSKKLWRRRNTVTGVMYRDDPNIFGYELMNEARCLIGRKISMVRRKRTARCCSSPGSMVIRYWVNFTRG